MHLEDTGFHILLKINCVPLVKRLYCAHVRMHQEGFSTTVLDNYIRPGGWARKHNDHWCLCLLERGSRD